VTARIDGQNYMLEWHNMIRAMIGVAGAEIYHSAWRLEGVHTLGYSHPDSNALDTLYDAHSGGVVMYLALSMHTFGGVGFNRWAGGQLWLHGITNARMDNRFPTRGSNHAKFACLKHPGALKALVGSIDISRTRWDTTDHFIHIASDRDPEQEQPTHDVGVEVLGPAIGDIERSFVARWNDPTRLLNLLPPIPPLTPRPVFGIPPPPLITTPISSPPVAGPHSVQVLETYGRTSVMFGYSWSPIGEFTIWASYLNAIKHAEHYIYIEDQYFLAWDWPVCHEGIPRLAQESDITYQLGVAINRGVKVIVVTPFNSEDPERLFQKYQKDLAANYLATAASNPSTISRAGDFVIAYLHNGTTEIYVHSKLMIVDDEFVLIGSANMCQRSMTHDGELQLGIVDDDDLFALNLRRDLWHEHLRTTIPTDWAAAFDLFKYRTTRSEGRVRPYPTIHPGRTPPWGHAKVITDLIDPYAGPDR
jgi:phosphatidylserine/phosphatidylglycerophosphate/cardiolipin synthase-like enzyme